MDFVYDSLTSELPRIKNVIAQAYCVNGDLMSEVASFLAESQGKLLRPCLVCLSARAHGIDTANPSEEGVINLASSIELFHTATLLHDDVIDRASTRRGRPTVNAKWGDDVAILFADYLYATSFDLALSTLKPETLRVLSQTTQRMTEGEFLQIERRGKWLSVDDYLEIITSKTAHLFSAATSLGALVAGASMNEVQRMAGFGLEFGLSFQITDDTLDYEAQSSNWGKRVGADLAEGKQTLPLLRTLRDSSPEDKEALISVLNNGRDFDTVQRYVRKYNAIQQSLEEADQHAQNALSYLENLSDENEAVAVLKRVAGFVTARQF